MQLHWRLFLILAITGTGLTFHATAARANEVATAVDGSYVVSPRADAMSGAISTTANGADSSYYNPAAIGGIFWGGKKLPAVRQLQFPFFSVSTNDNIQELQSEISGGQGAEDSSIGESAIEASRGERQFARMSTGVYVEMFRFSLMLFSDHQFAAVNPENSAPDPDTGSNIVSANYESTSGIGFGFSGSTLSESLYMGIFASNLSKDIFKSELTYSDLTTGSDRNKIISDESRTYSGLGINFGIIWKIADKGRPVLALVGRNIGDNKLQYKSGKEPDTPKELTTRLEKDLTLGFSVTPKVLGGELNIALDARFLNDLAPDIKQNLFSGLEYAYGGIGNDALVALRLGASAAGLSGGFKIGTGVLNLEAAISRIDIDKSSSQELESRKSILVNINVREIK